MKIKTSTLTGPALRYAVATAEGYSDFTPDDDGDWHTFNSRHGKFDYLNLGAITTGYYDPSIDWSQGGPIIERELINLSPPFGCEQPDAGTNSWGAYIANKVGQIGPTPLIAAMRCFVASKLGDEVDVPEELIS